MNPHRYQDRGPTDSAVHNDQMRELTAEVSQLYSRFTSLAAGLDAIGDLAGLDAAAVATFIEELKLALAAATSGTGNTCFVPVAGATVVRNEDGQAIDTDGTAIASKLHIDSRSTVLTLPQGPFVSKLRTWANINGDAVLVVHPEVQATYEYTGTAEAVSDPLDGVDGKMSTAFTVEDTDFATTQRLTYYVRVPVRGVATALTNVVDLTLAPLAFCRLLGVQYTTDPNPQLSSSDDWNNFLVTVDADDAPFYPPQYIPADPENPVYGQQNFSTRRYYVNEEKITALRFVIGPRLDESGKPVPLTVESLQRLVVGIRDVDAGYVSFADTGSLLFEVSLPEAVSSITSIVPRVINDRYVNVVPDVTCFAELTPGTWSPIEVGSTPTALGGVTKLRVRVSMDIVNRTLSPVVSGFDIAYEPGT